MKHLIFSHMEAFLRGESAAGLVLMGSAALALVAANTFIAPLYEAARALSLAGINDGLMALFFLLVSLEIKREIEGGELSTRAKAALPVIAAAGGMIVPALIYIAINRGAPADLRGWAIPTATDIAFALGVLALLGNRVSTSLKVFLTALAIIDDLGAIAIIALFYTDELSASALLAALGCILVLFALNRLKVQVLWAYLAVGAILWFCVLESGVHPTMAGVITAMAVPGAREERNVAPLVRLERALHPYVTFLILPLFAFANAGISFAEVTRDAALHPVTLGIALGLFLGKQAGVLVFIVVARSAGWVHWPADASSRQIYGVAVLTGIGFTMSFFVGALAFVPPLYNAELKIGVLGGSLVSALIGYGLLRFNPKH